ncbi:ATP-binding protein [Pyxidicoccus caerfyrddinensis]|uniref:ATP-binding protein n=1 Tax=Pyxidicoccus caerfyrddinensis TaxID=2709663 RepID=UPI0013DC57A2|nr:ATP-binding protein [Pyxidicoccus caerfyrddinensis]
MDPESTALLEQLHAILWRGESPSLRFTYVSEQAASLLGYAAEEWLAASFWVEHLHPDDRERTLGACRSVAADGEGRECVHRVIAADGSVLWFRTSVRRTSGEHAPVTELGGLMVLLEQGPRENEPLQYSEDHLRTLFNASPDAIFFKDGEGRWLAVNEAALKLFGLVGGEYQGKTDVELAGYSPFYREALLGCAETDRRAWAKGGLSRNEERIPTPNGTVYIYDVIKVPLFHPDGRRKGLVVLARNITDRKLAEQERYLLFTEEQKARASAEGSQKRSAFLAEASKLVAGTLNYEVTLAAVARMAVPFLADCCIFRLLEEDGATRVVSVAHEDRAQAGLAYELEQLAPDVLTGVDAVLHTGRSVLSSGMSSGTPSHDPAGNPLGPQTEERLRRVRELGFQSSMSVPLVTRGRMLGVLTFVSAREGRVFGLADLTLAEELALRAALAVENARLYRDAEEAINVRDEFLTSASHELKTPCTSLRLGVQGLLRLAHTKPLASVPSAFVERVLENADRQIQHLSRLVDKLLDISTITSGHLQLGFKEVDLAALARDVVEHYRQEVGHAASTVTVRAEAPAVGRWDPSWLEHVIGHLLSNALRYGAGKPIEVEVAADAHQARLVLRDHGIGIAPEHQALLFERLQDGGTARSYGGLGLSLPIVRRIVEAMGGSIRLESEPGAGSTFTVELPGTDSLGLEEAGNAPEPQRMGRA